LIRQLKPDSVPSRRDVFNFKSDHIAAAQLAVDGQIEQGQVAHATSNSQHGRYRPNLFGSQWRLWTYEFYLIPGHALRRQSRGALNVSMMILPRY